MHQIALPTGKLELRVDRCTLPLDQLCGFAGRNNPRRGFLFVSKVLGKHWACTPQAMLQVFSTLTEQIDLQMLDGAVVIGMAETATGLGHGIYEACVERTRVAGSNGPALYLQSTRYPLADAEVLDFEEVHSHAAQQLLYLPQSPKLRERMLNSRNVILVDDEISTGRTLANLVSCLRRVNAQLQNVVLVCLTDFSEGMAERNVHAIAGIEAVTTAALLHGRFRFDFDPEFVPTAAAPAFAAMSCRREYMSDYSARLGLAEVMQLPAALVAECVALCNSVDVPCSRVLVLGTGEFMHASYVLAQVLTQHGITAWVQSTSRSPILVGADIHSKLEVPDPYGEGISNYLYNVQREDYDHVFVVHETPRNPELLELCALLGAHAVSLADHVVLPATRTRCT
jgi:hypothetical protein